MQKLFFLLLISTLIVGCQNTISSSENKTQINQNTTAQTPENIPKVKWIFLQEPLDFNSKTGDVISSTALIFFETGEVTTTNVNLYKKEQKIELLAFFDEVVLLGTWKEDKDEVKINFENCRCQHCKENHGEKMSKKQMADFVPFTQVLKRKIDKSYENKQLLVKGNEKYRLIKESDYVFGNYNEMVSEALKIKNAESDEKCIVFDLEGL